MNICIAMSLADSERVIAAAEVVGVTQDAVHPLRLRPSLIAVRERMLSGEEHLRHVNARFFLHRLENVGGTGYRCRRVGIACHASSSAGAGSVGRRAWRAIHPGAAIATRDMTTT